MQVHQKNYWQRSGAAVVETAFVLGIFMALLLGLIEFCRLLWVRQMCENAVRDGARYAVVHQGDKATTDVQNRTWEAMGGNTSTNYNPVGNQLRSHSNVNNPFIKAADSTSDIRVYRSAAAGTPEGINLSTSVTTAYTADNWASADWRNAQFGDYVAVQIVCKYKPIVPLKLYTFHGNKIQLFPGTIDLTFTSLMSSESNQ